MPDNLHATAADAAAPLAHRVIALCGRDAVAFAQAQFMNDAVALEAGHWQWNGWLTAKGRVIALFALAKLDGETLWLVVPDADAFAVAEQLRRFVFRRKLTVEVREDLAVSGAFEAPAKAAGARLAMAGDGSVALDMGGEGARRTLWIRPRGTGTASAEPAHVARWAAADLLHGLPRLPASQAEHWTPQQLSLDRLAAYSVKKGCYPGQEIVARTHFLGQAKRGLALFESDTPMAPGHEIREDGAVFGTVIASANPPGQALALAVVPLDRMPAAPHCEGVPVRPVSLAGGLAR